MANRRPKNMTMGSPVTCKWTLAMIDAAKAGMMIAVERLYEQMMAEGYPITKCQGALAFACSHLPLASMEKGEKALTQCAEEAFVESFREEWGHK